VWEGGAIDPHMVALGEENREAGFERHKSTTQVCGVNGEDGRNVKKGAAAHRVQSYAAGHPGSRIARDLGRSTHEKRILFAGVCSLPRVGWIS